MKTSNICFSFAMIAILAACGAREEIQQGQRIDIDDLALNGQAPTERSSVAVRLASISARDWAQHLGGAENIAPNASLSASPKLIAAVNLHTTVTPGLFGNSGTHRSVYGASAPIMVGNTIYHYDSDGYLHSISANGSSKWRVSLVPPGQSVGDGYGGGVAYNGGVLYVATGYGQVVALDANTGGEKWRYVQNAPLRQAPVVSGGKVIVISGGSTGIALNAADGTVSWRHFGAQTDMPTRLNAGVPAASNGVAYLAYSSGTLAKVNIATGEEIWSKTAITDLLGGSKSVFSDVTGDPVISGNDLIVGTQSGILSIEPSTGFINWTSTIGTKGPLLVSGNAIMGVTPSEEVFRLDRSNGSRVYRRDLPKKTEGTLSFGELSYGDLRLANNTLMVADDDKHLLRVDANSGTVQSISGLPAEFAAAPIFANGYMVVMAETGQLLIYR